jgi:hypothetical protein
MTTFYCLETPPTSRARFPYLYPQEQRGPVIPPDSGLSQVKVTLRLTVSQQVLVSSPMWGPWPDIYYSLIVMDLFFWGALSDGRTGLSFVYAAGPRQRSLSRVRVPRDSWPYFTLSDLRLPFSSPPTTRRVTVEVFDPAFTPVWVESKSQSYVTTDGFVGQSVLA